jgi:hypothetical protein
MGGCAASKVAKEKTPEEVYTSACAEFEKVKRAASQARSKVYPFIGVTPMSGKLSRWAEKRLASDQAPEITDSSVNQLLRNLANQVKLKLDTEGVTKESLEIVSFLNWAVNGKLLTFWRDSKNSPQIHNA